MSPFHPPARTRPKGRLQHIQHAGHVEHDVGFTPTMHDMVRRPCDKFCDSSFPSVAWELRIKKVYKKYNYNIAIWLRQIGPTSINSLVNTKYKIYANSDGVYLDIAK
uniref:Gb3_synth domain-containing protein n=1 Tax=Meloidogyne hapla TaxID=6305 RepID=A0A1I8BUK3_MELHA